MVWVNKEEWRELNARVKVLEDDLERRKLVSADLIQIKSAPYYGNEILVKDAVKAILAYLKIDLVQTQREVIPSKTLVVKKK